MTTFKGKSAEVLRLALGRYASSRVAQDDKQEGGEEPWRTPRLFHCPGLKPRVGETENAALKRRSSTVVRAEPVPGKRAAPVGAKRAHRVPVKRTHRVLRLALGMTNK
jgi:hypothetical protein